uniref:SWI/SNF-related matrix-associated actin-dependent regulator of chromatin subfamily A-like protein 1 n=1 Tax=Clastoptera arizonana TaxID=38151 RepID=A0A1B6C6H6_9HEMI
MTSSLTPEQLKRIEQNRKLALEKRAASLLVHNQPQLYEKGNKNVSTSQNSCSVLLSSKSASSFYNNTPQSSVQPYKKSKEPVWMKYRNKNGSYSDNSLTKPNTVTGCCRLISEDRFTVDIPYHKETVEVFKTVKGFLYDSQLKQWNFPLTEYQSFKQATDLLRPSVSISPLPTIIFDIFLNKNTKTNLHKIDITKVEVTLRNNAYPFQIEGIQFGVSKEGRCLLADDMGLGKTIQALGIADYYHCDWPLLIVCPSSMKFQWEEEIHKNLPNIPVHHIFILNKSKDVFENIEVLIMSYDMVGKKLDAIKAYKFGVVIVDESHNLKNPKAQRTIAAIELFKSCKRIILLSGTPALSRPKELYTQINSLDSSVFSNFHEFGKRYCDGKKDHFGWNFEGSSNMEELKLILNKKFMIRRLKSEVITQLPNKVRQIIILNNEGMNTSNKSMKLYSEKLKMKSVTGMERRGTLLSYFAETGKVKGKAVCDYISTLLADGKKFLCFGHHKEVLDLISDLLENNNTFYIRIDGSVSAEERKLLCDRFQYEDKFRVAVLSITAANTGLTLTSAQLVVFAELFWNPGVLVQAEDRAHRIGQRDCVFVHYLMAKGTADDHLWPLIQKKLEVLHKAGLSKDNFKDSSTETFDLKTSHQTSIDDFLEVFDEGDDEALLSLMDEVEGIPEKKKKII